ncbi:MAG: aspartyl-tRNA amidotransferase [Acidiphilium sp. 37-64-53]|uniref:GatB/YqeY domain-containing protein n=1 Tax=Acidiphilium TaxID=522 RepID=UPI000BDC6BD2|nr:MULTISPECIES: GatB/YqeY domain-containing protein [Acidiphilium]OYW02593.1 MAG: aspartyl-tRNA amidotransferase [Acidiphilium sp. 37-64-53]OZB29881.1 MAG: aspartyl-tRNA amidotransferase [Acidiphilium sp. 34-64-41]HQT84023.1 GatB/YqeY domain-containing protein [Acidiphilium rubrum]
MSALRTQIQADLKAAMLARQPLTVSTLRMAAAKLKDADIAARPKGIDAIADEDIVALLRGMVKTRRESEAQYRQGNRPDLADQEAAEIVILEAYLPQTLHGAALDAAIAQAITTSGAAGPKDMGKVIAALKSAHGPALDMAAASAAVKAKLAAS